MQSISNSWRKAAFNLPFNVALCIVRCDHLAFGWCENQVRNASCPGGVVMSSTFQLVGSKLLTIPNLPKTADEYG